ncbi:MAG: hypothetical protein KBF29_10935 [Sterolibacterium sp.]|nr:hypothetical protein [Sterolibacterium sp.]
MVLRSWLRIVAWCCVGGLASLVHAESTGPAAVGPDPTRPPALLTTPEPAVTEGGSGVAEGEAAASGLQTIILRRSAGKKPMAIINGQAVELGGAVGEVRLVKLSETEAVLQGANGKEVLKLTPGVERKNVVPPVVHKAKKKTKAKPKLKTRAQRQAKKAIEPAGQSSNPETK